MPGTNRPYTRLDFTQVLQQAFDEANDRLRVDAAVTATIGDLKITDGTSTVSITTQGAKKGLDVNLLNNLSLAITDEDDSIKIGDNSGYYLTINSDGSIKNRLYDSTGNSLTSSNGSLNINLPGVTTTVMGEKKLLDVSVANNTIAGIPIVDNISMPIKNTEYSYSLIPNTKQIMFKTRDNSTLKFTFEAGKSGISFITVPPGSSYTLSGIDPTIDLSLYFQASDNPDTLEIISWV